MIFFSFLPVSLTSGGYLNTAPRNEKQITYHKKIVYFLDLNKNSG